MKTLVAYYTLSGTTKEVAERIAEKLNADTEAIIDLKKRNGSIRFMMNGAHATFKRSTRIKEPVYDPSGYDLIVICSPVWAWKITPAVRAYCRRVKTGMKKAAFVLTAGGEIEEKVWKSFVEEGGAPQARLGITRDDRKTGSDGEKIDRFIRAL